MKLSIYGDAHITRKMGSIQNYWDNSVVSIFEYLYEQFSSDNIEMAVCLGDLFDKAVLEARSVKLVTRVLSIMNSATFPTYVLLGNHEIDSNEHNVLEYLSEYENIIPITNLINIEGKYTFVPYSTSLKEVPYEYINGTYLFTHHDIYGSELAGGKVKASFGEDPKILSSAIAVFNGHVHLDSKFSNIYNVGSITKMQQGELKLGGFPVYYYLDTNTAVLDKKSLKDNIILHLTLSPEELQSTLSHYGDNNKFVLRIQYSEDSQLSLIDSFKSDSRILSISLRKNMGDSIGESVEIRRSTLDIKEFLADYIKKDLSIPEEDKDNMILLGISLLGD